MAVQQFILAKIFDDPTPSGLVNNRYLRQLVDLFNYTTLSEDQQKMIFDLMLLVGRKLVSVWLHMQKYEEIEDRLIAQARSSPISKADSVVFLE